MAMTGNYVRSIYFSFTEPNKGFFLMQSCQLRTNVELIIYLFIFAFLQNY